MWKAMSWVWIWEKEKQIRSKQTATLQHCLRPESCPSSIKCSVLLIYMGWVLFIVIVSGIWILFMFRWLGLIKIGKCVPYRLTGRPSIQYIRQYAYYRAKSGWWVCSPGTGYTVCAVSAAPTWPKKLQAHCTVWLAWLQALKMGVAWLIFKGVESWIVFNNLYS